MSKKIPPVLAFEKKLVPSDGRFYGTRWDQKHGADSIKPLKIIEKSVRGTISNRLLPNKIEKHLDPLKLNAAVEKPNLQKVDCCALSADQDTLKMHFTLKILPHVEHPSACNRADFKHSYTQAVKNYIERTGFSELAKRYAYNIANARFLWRNRVGAEKIIVQVKVLNGEDKSWEFDATEFKLNDFLVNENKVWSLSEKIANALSGKTSFLLLDINAYAKVGIAQEVYPSEELILDKGNFKGQGKKSKVLYHIDEVAAMHSQKIGNALRCIDTWYPQSDHENEQINGPIAAEPYGAVTNLGKAYRHPNDKKDFFTLFDKFALGEPLESEEEEHFIMAVLVRGGVFGESSKKKE